jgi:signal transduction histidine kinase
MEVNLAMDQRMIILNEIARRISADLDLQATLDAVVAAAAELIPCALAEVSLWDPETEMLTLLAIRCDPDRTYPVGKSFPLGEGYTGWMVHHRQSLLVPDVMACHTIRPHLLPGEKPFNAYLGVPLLSAERLIGTLVLVANEAGAFDSEDQQVLQALGHHAATAIRNARLYEQVTRRHRALSALYAVAEVVNQPLDLQEILDRALKKVVEVTGAHGGAIRLLDTDTDKLVLTAHQGLSEAYVQGARCYPLTEEIVGWVARTGMASLSEDMWNDPRVSPQIHELLEQEGHRSLAQVPLRAKEQIVGTLGVVARSPCFFDEDDLELLQAIGQQVGVAIANAHLREEALTAERMAAVGRVATSVAHDLRSPLGGIVRSAEFLARPELSPETRQKLSQAIVSLARRLINTTQEILDYVRDRPLPLNRVPCSLPEFLDQVLAVMDVDFADRGIEVVRNCTYMGTVVMDADRIAQVVYNIAANARDAMPHGGVFTVTTREVESQVELSFADTGPGVPNAFQDRIFEPFFTRGKREGSGLGLAIARRIVEEHGGELTLKEQEGPGATFVVSLPI